jgi:hypothetical protein
MTETKPIEVWLAVQKSTGLGLFLTLANTKTGAKGRLLSTYTWDNRKWTIAPYTLTPGHKEKRENENQTINRAQAQTATQRHPELPCHPH